MDALSEVSERAGVATATAGALAMRRRPAVSAALLRTAYGRLEAPERPLVEAIERRRRELLADDRMLERSPGLGAGAGGDDDPSDSRPRRLGDVVASASISPRYGLLLMRLARAAAPCTAVETGTGFGISGLYLSAGLSLGGGGMLLTLDGSEPVQAIAREGFERLAPTSVDARIGTVESALGPLLSKLPERPGLAFLDAGHEEETTLATFERVAAASIAGGLVVLDDVGWSEGMGRAWRRLRTHARVATAIRVRRLGLCVLGRP